MIQRQPGLLSLPSLSRVENVPFPPFASSSSMSSWGLIVIWTTLGESGLNLESLSGALSSSNLPKDINLIELGLDGFCSHSSLHSRSISSFKVYTLKFEGSLSCTLTFLLCIYRWSNLNGCLAPLVKRRVIINVGPVASVSFGTGKGWSDDGPIAVDTVRSS